MASSHDVRYYICKNFERYAPLLCGTGPQRPLAILVRDLAKCGIQTTQQEVGDALHFLQRSGILDRVHHSAQYLVPFTDRCKKGGNPIVAHGPCTEVECI